MPITKITMSEAIEQQYKLLNELKTMCKKSKHLNPETFEKFYIFSIDEKWYNSPKGPAMLAVAEYTDKLAVHMPKYLNERQELIFESFLEGASCSNDKIVVFSNEVFENMKKYSYGRKLNIILDV